MLIKNFTLDVLIFTSRSFPQLTTDWYSFSRAAARFTFSEQLVLRFVNKKIILYDVLDFALAVEHGVKLIENEM